MQINIKSYQIISNHIKSFQIISNHIKPYQIISIHINIHINIHLQPLHALIQDGIAGPLNGDEHSGEDQSRVPDASLKFLGWLCCLHS